MFSPKSILLKPTALGRCGLIICFAILASISAQAQRPLGADISGYQSNTVNWVTVKNAGVVFAWTKATEGTYYYNPWFNFQESGATNAGIYIGAYHFARPSDDPNITGANSADSEARYFWSIAGGYVKAGGGYLVPMLDWEDPNATNGGGFTISQMSAWVNEWCNDVSNDAAAQGVIVRPVVYTGTWYSVPTSGGFGYPGLDTTVTNWPDWFAAYPATALAQTGTPGGNSPWPSWNIWQYGDTNWSGGDSDVYNGNWQSFLQMFAIGGTNAPYFVSLPTSVTVPMGSNATFSAKLSGQPACQWYFDGNAIPGATSSNYTIIDAQITNAGVYSLSAGNSYGTVSGAAVLSVLGPLTNAPNAALDPANMTNWWTGNGNPNDIYGVNNGAPFGKLSYTNGEVGMGFLFDGTTAYLSNNVAETASPWTVCAWIYRQNAPGVSAALLGDGTCSVKIQQYAQTADIGFSYSGWADYYFKIGLKVNAWSHLALTYNGSQMQLYTNGVLATSQLYSNNIAINPRTGMPLPRSYVGVNTFSGSPADFLQGAVNELQIYTRVLSAAEVSSIYHAGTNGLVRAPQFTGISTNGNGQVQLNLIGQTGKAITINTSTDLLNWAQIGVISNQFGATNYTDSNVSGPLKFYQTTQKY
jgi:GH25 family lysozyme M1 (1,4-beta-N-acetylmuramidase)